MREEFTDEQDPAAYERGHERIIQAIRDTGRQPVPAHASRPHMGVVRDSAPPKPLELPRERRRDSAAVGVAIAASLLLGAFLISLAMGWVH